MSDVPTNQHREELANALRIITQLADNATRMSGQIGKLADALEMARSETAILAKVLAQSLGRECVSDRNPVQRLDILLRPLVLAAEIFTPELEENSYAAIMRRAGVTVPGPTDEEQDQAARDAVVAQSYREIAQSLRDEAMKVIGGGSRVL